jgi:hypothetical protein
MGILIQATKSRPELTKQAGIIVLALLPALLLPSFFLDIKEGIFKTTYFVLYYAGLSMLFLVIWMLRGFSRKFFIAGLSALIVVTAMPLWNIPLQVSLSGKPEAAGLHDYAGDIFKPEMVRQKIVRAGATFEFVPSSVQKFVAGTFVDERNIVEVIEGKADISEIKRKSDYLSFSVKSSETARLLVRIFYFPGWTCYINGGKTSGTVDNQGRMLFSVAPGGYSIVLKFENTGIRTGSNIAAFITAVFLLGMALYLWVRQRRKGKE